MAGLESIAQAEDPEKVARVATAFMDELFERLGLADNPVVRGMRDGLTPAQSLGLTRDDLTVIYTLGFNKLNAGDVARAHDVFTYLVMIDPLHAPNHYCLGVAEQARGENEAAERCFTQFLALDATNPAGYLRWGECCLAKGDTKMARETFSLARSECLAGNGTPALLAEAEAKLAALKTEMKA